MPTKQLAAAEKHWGRDFKLKRISTKIEDSRWAAVSMNSPDECMDHLTPLVMEFDVWICPYGHQMLCLCRLHMFGTKSSANSSESEKASLRMNTSLVLKMV